MITSDLAPEPVEQTDTNPRALCLCGCDAHPDGKCPNRWCGCRVHRDQGALTALGCVVVLVALGLLLLAAGLVGDHLRCQRLTASHSPSASTYCNGDPK